MKWHEEIVTISTNPYTAAIQDIRRLALELIECRQELARLQGIVDEEDYDIIEEILTKGG